MKTSRTARLRIGIGLVVGFVLAMGAPGVQYAAGHLFPSVGAYSYPQRPVFLGRASAIVVNGARIVGDTGDVRTPAPGDTTDGLAQIYTGVVDVRVPSAANHRRLFDAHKSFDPISASIAGTAAVKIVALGTVIESDSVGSMAVAQCGGKRSGETHVENLRINGAPVAVASVPFTSLNAGLVRVSLNEQWRAADGQIVVTALHVRGSGLDISVGYTRAGLQGCAEAGSGWAALLDGARPPADPFVAPRAGASPRDCGIGNAIVGAGRCPVRAPLPVTLVLTPDPVVTSPPVVAHPHPSPSGSPRPSPSPSASPSSGPLSIPLPFPIPLVF